MNRLALTIATWFGCGYFPVGSRHCGLASGSPDLPSSCTITVSAGHAGNPDCRPSASGRAIWAATRTARIVNREDPGMVVVDEVLGQWVTLLGAPARNWKSLSPGFLLFRLFDIWKPWPVRNFERLPEGTGIVADDLAAGVYGALILYIGGFFRLY